MFAHEDNRRKNNSSHALKSVFNTNSHSSLLATIDKKRSDLSKDKYPMLYAVSGSTTCPNRNSPI
jgi:hypothetical protein